MKEIYVLTIALNEDAGNYLRDIPSYLANLEGQYYNGEDYEKIPEKEADWFAGHARVVQDDKGCDDFAGFGEDSKSLEMHFNEEPPKYICSFIIEKLPTFPLAYSKGQAGSFGIDLVESKLKIKKVTLSKRVTNDFEISTLL